MEIVKLNAQSLLSGANARDSDIASLSVVVDHDQTWGRSYWRPSAASLMSLLDETIAIPDLERFFPRTGVPGSYQNTRSSRRTAAQPWSCIDGYRKKTTEGVVLWMLDRWTKGDGSLAHRVVSRASGLLTLNVKIGSVPFEQRYSSSWAILVSLNFPSPSLLLQIDRFVSLIYQPPEPYEPMLISRDSDLEPRNHELQTPLGRTMKGNMASVAQAQDAALKALHRLQYEYDEEATMTNIEEGHFLLDCVTNEADTMRNVKECTDAIFNDHLWDMNEGGIVTEWASCGNTGYRLGVQCKVEPMPVPTDGAPMLLN